MDPTEEGQETEIRFEEKEQRIKKGGPSDSQGLFGVMSQKKSACFARVPLSRPTLTGSSSLR